MGGGRVQNRRTGSEGGTEAEGPGGGILGTGPAGGIVLLLKAMID